MCAGPYRRGVEEWPCGKCAPCLKNRQRIWVSRLMLEARMHARKCFATLTYDPKHVPSDGSLSPRHMVLFMKRLRKRVEPIQVRYFYVGEYGDQNQRPHYHVVLFGVDRDEDIRIAWGMGMVHVGFLQDESAAYCVSYVLKHMTASSDPRLKGRHPEFARMSLRPGIGRAAMGVFAESYMTDEGSKALIRAGDVVSEFRSGKEKYPLGRYLRNKLREELGRPSNEPLALREERLKRAQDDLSLPGAWALREAKREATRERARARIAIYRSKKGIGV